jgi:uncharacterized membrane protein
MREVLITASEYAIDLIDMVALLVVVYGTLEAVVSALLFAMRPGSGDQRREIWLRYARWLVAALTFQLAADIIETSITTSWDALGRIAVIAVIRTFLNYFLDRDVTEVRERRHGAVEQTEVAK